MANVEQMNRTTNTHQTLAHLLCTSKIGEDIVAFDMEKQWTWQRFLHDIRATSDMLEHSTSQRVAVCTLDSYQFAVGFLACCYAGKSVVLPGNYQNSALTELSSQFDLLLHDAGIEPIATKPCEKVAIDSHLENLESFSALDLKQVEIILFTSGSSGTPKAIVKTLEHLDTEIAILESIWGDLLGNALVESTVSHQHIYGLLFRVLWPLCTGRAFACRNLEYPEQVMTHASANRVLVSSPALLKRLSTQTAPAEIRALFSSGGPLPYDAAKHAHGLFGQLPIEVYGSTETGGIAYKQQYSPSEFWRLFPGIEAELNHEQCLKLKSPHIDADNWYQTADACVFHDAQRFELKGRTDRIVKIEEKRISLVEVEKRLDQLDWIYESAVFCCHDQQRLSLNAAIVLTPAGLDKLKSLGKGKFWLLLRAELRQWIEPIAVPRRFRVVAEIPLNSQGKRQVSELEKLFADSL